MKCTHINVVTTVYNDSYIIIMCCEIFFVGKCEVQIKHKKKRKKCRSLKYLNNTSIKYYNIKLHNIRLPLIGLYHYGVLVQFRYRGEQSRRHGGEDNGTILPQALIQEYLEGATLNSRFIRDTRYYSMEIIDINIIIVNDFSL